MKSKKPRKQSEVLEIFSASKLVSDLMNRDGLTPDQMMKKSGMPTQHIVAIREGKLPITPENASLFERCFDWPAIRLLDAQLRDYRAMIMVYCLELRDSCLLLKMLEEVEKLKDLIEKK